MDKLYLPPSSFDRWSVCPGSAYLRCKYDLDKPAGKWALEGIQAHKVAAAAAGAALRRAQSVKKINAGADAPREEKLPKVNAAMQRHADEWADLLVWLADLYELTDIWIESKMIWEKRLVADANFSHVRQSSFMDFLGYNRKTKTIVLLDYKYGSGLAVDVDGNGQLANMLLLAQSSLGLEVDRALIGIHQPRVSNPVKVQWLSGVAEVSQRVALQVGHASRNQREFKPGDHCRWCPALDRCDAVREHAQQVAQVEFASVPVVKRDLPNALDLPADKVAMILHNRKAIESFLDEVQKSATNRAQSGETFPGFKLVESRGHRAWTISEKEIRKRFKDKAIVEVVRSPAQLEKIVGKGVIDPLVDRPLKGAVLAPNSDKRPAWKEATQAKQDFLT